MIPLRIAGATRIMTSPRESDTHVRDLHILEHDGCSISRWEPTPAELELLNGGGSVELWVMGWQPPVMLIARAHAEIDESTQSSEAT